MEWRVCEFVTAQSSTSREEWMMGEGGGKEQQVRQTRSLEMHSRSRVNARGCPVLFFSFLFHLSTNKKHSKNYCEIANIEFHPVFITESY